MKTTYSLAEARRKIERYCTYQERCHIEVEKKLLEMGMIPLVREELIIALIEANYLNESRFAQSFARGKFRNKKWGKVRIQRELKARKITDYNIKLGLKEISESDYNTTFWALFEKKKAALSSFSLPVQKKKLFDYLAYRGWETEKIFEAIELLKK